MRQTADNLFSILNVWDQLLAGKAKIHLIACGGTALTLLGYKESTKDIDFLIPDLEEYKRLIDFLERAGYENLGGRKWRRKGEVLEYDLFPGNTVLMTELPRSPLEKDKHKKIREYQRIYLGVLNSYDLIVTKMARGTQVDFDDCLVLLRNEKDFNWEKFRKYFIEASKHSINFGIHEEKAMSHFVRLEKLFQEGEK